MINIEIDNAFKSKKAEDLIDLPVIVTVNEFNESAVKNFHADVLRASQSSQPVIPILIDSYGGCVYSLLAMIDIIRSCKKSVATICVGKAMSCGVILFSCGTDGMRFASANSTFMIHDASSMSMGKIGEIKSDTEQLIKLNNLIYTILAKNCGKREDYFTKLVHKRGHADWYIGTEEAVQYGLVNKIGIPSLNVRLKVEVDFT